MRRDSRLASCDYITMTQKKRRGGRLCGVGVRHLERCEMEGALLGLGSRAGEENK